MICNPAVTNGPLKKAIMNKGIDVASQKCEHLNVISELSQTCVSCQHQSRYSENKGKKHFPLCGGDITNSITTLWCRTRQQL